MGNDKQNIIEKIADRFAVGLPDGARVHAGDYIAISPAHVMSHDNTGAIIPKFLSIGAAKLARPRQVMIGLDHRIQDTGEENLAKYAKIAAFAAEMGADFYPAGRGIVHQVLCEEGYVLPGGMVVASDSHSNMYGGLGCLGTPIVRTDAAAIWATGRTWWQVPPVAKVILEGTLRPGVTAKDIIVTLCGFFNEDDVLNHAVEFTGPGVSALTVDERLTIANMTTEWGALAGVFPADDKTFDWLFARAETIANRGLEGVPSDADGAGGQHPRLNRAALEKRRAGLTTADEGAFYAKELTLDIGTVSPHVSGPDHVKVMAPVADMAHVNIDKAYLVSCVNARVEDLALAADVVRGKKVADRVEFYVAAASSEVQAASEARGDWQALVDAGARALPPGCGPCIGLGVGLLEDGEVGISATNRNFKGRMGSRSAEAYLASPAVVAASAVAGHIAPPHDIALTEISGRVDTHERPAGGAGAVALIDGFPKNVTGEVVFCHADNLNTDGIFPGKYTYLDDFTAAEQAEVAMENYDPAFKTISKSGDILAGGFNFGTGSSREQAATALKHRGIKLVIAGSISETYKRNAINNGFLVIACPSLVEGLKADSGEDELTKRIGKTAEVRFDRAEILFDGKRYAFSPVGTAAQELIVADGLENWVKAKLAEEADQ
jgi:homoaconitate hydratase